VPTAHYENFPVASRLLPRHLREPVAAIYWFARSADDIADEGVASDESRLAALAEYRRQLDAIESGARIETGPWRTLAAHIAERRLPIAPFRDLLSAFEQDVTVKRYATFAALDDYCRRSANPVGRLLLVLFGVEDDEAMRESDRICTGLQLINFCQDVRIDWDKDRVYIPQDDLATFGVDEAQIARGRVDDAWRALFAHQLSRALGTLDAGSALPRRLAGRARLELAAIVAGGRRIAQRLAATEGDVFRRRPQLAARDWMAIGISAVGSLRAPRLRRPEPAAAL
jgi:squalene synthase HpnC